MKFQTYLIKYGEIGIKGKNRYMFEDALVRQIKHSLKDLDGLFHTYKAQGRVYTLREIGQKQGKSIERIRQIETKALKTMRAPRRCRTLRGYYEVYLSAAPIHHVGVRQFQRTWESEVERAVLRKADKMGNN